MMDPGEGSSSTSKSRKQRFRDAWIEQPEFQGWLAAVPGDPFRAFCKVCSASMVAGSSELKKHAERQGHKKAMLGLQKQHLLTGFIQKKPKDSMDDKVKMAEIKLSAFITEHSLSFKAMDHMGELVKTVFPDSKIAEQVRLHKTKCTSIVKNVLAKAEVQSLSAILRETRFSLFVDEGTDVSSTKLLCCVVRYYCDAVDDVITQLLEVIPLDATSCSAESLATAVEQCLNHKEIPMKNIIALACDNASVMVGEHNSLMTRLRANADRSFVTIRCICHSLHIAASKAAMKLPRNLEDLLKNVASYFGHSCKRQAQLADLQEYLKTEKHRILRPSETRWLALQKCVERVLQEWDTLKLLFLQASVEDRVAAAGQILAEMNPINEAYLKFMAYVLGFFNKMNALFQSKENLIAVMQQESLRLIRCLCQNFMRPEAIQDVEKLNPMDPRSLLPLEEVYLGESCQELLQSMEGGSSDIKHLRLRCLEFYQTAVFEVKKRLPVSRPFYHEVQFVQPSTALSYEARKQLPVLPVLQRRYTHLLPRADALQGEWRMLPSFFTESEKALLREKPAASFWGEMSKLKNFEGKPEFENIACLAKLVLTLPHSNAETERIFSLLTDVKTRKRNRLAPDSINAVLVVKSGMTARSETCTNFKVEKKHMKLFTSEIYKA